VGDVTLTFQIVLAINHGHYYFSARSEMKYQQLSIAYLILSDLLFIKRFT